LLRKKEQMGEVHHLTDRTKIAQEEGGGGDTIGLK